YAESVQIIIGLENPAEGHDQIIDSGRTGAAVVRQIGSDFVKLNYDFGNAYTYSQGKLIPACDYREALPYACHLHLKDLKKSINGWDFTWIGNGIIDYDAIFQELVEAEKLLPMSIEHLFIFAASEHFSVHRLGQPPALSQISTSLKNSFDYVNAALTAPHR
ncbi:MAG: sugar phosphate isomerase/epimerase, partial [Desulfobacterales bacterium]